MTDIAIQTISPRQMAWKRFKGHKAALVCCGILGFLVLAVILSPLTTRYGVNESVKAPPNSYLSPSKLAWLGTDDIGRDLYSRLIYGTRVSLLIGLSSAFISVFVGCVVGAVAGFRGGDIEAVYTGTKHAQVGFAGALDRELRVKGVRVALVCPAGVETEFALGFGRTAGEEKLKTYLRPEDVAFQITTIMSQPRSVRTHVWKMWSMGQDS